MIKHLKISSSTLRMQVSSSASLDHLKFLFEDYELVQDRQSAFQRISEPPSTQNKLGLSGKRFTMKYDNNSFNNSTFSWLVHFRSTAEAQRAFQQLDKKRVMFMPVTLFHYT